jgi:hypothetical protein
MEYNLHMLREKFKINRFLEAGFIKFKIKSS